MQLDLKALTPQEGVEYRHHDCPACGHKNCFAIKRENGIIKYHCFRAACNLRGNPKYARSAEEITRALARESVEGDLEFTVPDYFQFGVNSDKILDMLHRYNSFEAYVKGYITIGYDPKENRLIFFIKDKGKIVGAVGRTLSNSPLKSRIYLNSKGCITVGKGKTLVLVEDPFSACSIARDEKYTGCALLGTNLTDNVREKIKEYSTLMVCLDKDASVKSLKIADHLRFLGKDVKVRLLDKDLKDCYDLPNLD